MMIDALHLSRVNRRFLGLLTAILIAGFGISSATAVPLNGIGSFSQPTTVIDFENFTVGDQTPTTADATIHAEFQGFPYPDFTPSDVYVRSQGFVQHAGIFEGQYYGFNAVDYVIEFNGLVQEFGVGIFDPNFAGNVLIAYDVFGNELERVTSGTDAEFQTGPIGGSFSTFVGFTRDTADIKTIRLSHASADVLGIDNVTYSALVPATVNDDVPEPGTGLIFLGSLLGLGLLKRRGPA
ncbi:MAG: PEP-CTERM sorting domain-containing protein [Alphaproteobacteria bacterium]